MLLEAGPELGRPLANRVRRSRLERPGRRLRPGSAGRGEITQAVRLRSPGGTRSCWRPEDQAGEWEAWYRQAIPLAEQRYEDYLKQEDIR